MDVGKQTHQVPVRNAQQHHSLSPFNFTMDSGENKENIASGLVLSAGEKHAGTSPRRSKKSRSLSMGPGTNVPLKKEADRRKVCAVICLTESN
jgi:hypothetical protein